MTATAKERQPLRLYDANMERALHTRINECAVLQPLAVQKSARDVLHYARGDEQGRGLGYAAILELADALLLRPIDSEQYDLDRLDSDVSEDDPLGLVLLGACGRMRLEQHKPISPKQLGVLAGVDPQHVRLMVRNGQLRGVPGSEKRGLVDPDSAIHELKERFIAGFAERAT